MREEELDSILDKTMMLERIRNIRRIYDTLAERQVRYSSVFSICCAHGCGACCEHFDPDITQVEAEFLAYGLILDDKADKVLEVLSNADETHCPLYDHNDMEHHCTVYRWRPLICRLFGFAASLDKQGRPVFKACKFNKDSRDIPTDMLEQHGDAVVLMRDYGIMISELNGDDTSTELLNIALPKALDKVRFMMELEKSCGRD